MNDAINKLLALNCRDYSQEESSLNLSEVEQWRKLTPEWQFCATENELSQTFHFANYADTIHFVNAVAKVAEADNHHPEMEVSFKRCKVTFYTHTVRGVTLNDFICAAKIDAALPQLNAI
ncbi:4a-hydroxytetrahydrobiopterin dehydratase [Arenicella xantha]|uniref:4a-hydroxytetrahydrobiopterin dehydratase n=1 Tax=Arenicella xantha TaxID=644221 RepID=A0A395JHJ8_9GAMM|nr:4a-hydroxytetrahydrobiopterin dehydratase [Arenicella xantha]RBP49305.1 pterin-4-alpha-carbinolamine dehydratase [Arenicella xantha]